MEKKYKLTDNFITHNGKKLFQIQAIKSFSDVSEGNLGGYIENGNNLSQDGDAWVLSDARVYGNAWISGDAWVYGNARVYGNALVYGNARVSGDALISGDAWVYGNARVYGNALVYGNARVSGDALVYGNARVYGNALVYGNARVSGDAWVYGNARVSFKGDYLSVGPFGMNSRMITIGDNIVNAGCFSGTFEEFKNAVAKKYGSDYGSYIKAIQIIDNIKF